MKKLLILLLFSFFLRPANAQITAQLAEAKAYIDSVIVNNNSRSITPLKLNTALNKILAALNYIDSAGLLTPQGDSILFGRGTVTDSVAPRTRHVYLDSSYFNAALVGTQLRFYSYNGDSTVIELPGGGTAIPNNEIAYGNGTGITSNSDFFYSPGSGGLFNVGFSGNVILQKTGNNYYFGDKDGINNQTYLRIDDANKKFQFLADYAVMEGNNKVMGIGSAIAFGGAFLNHNETAGGTLSLSTPAGGTSNIGVTNVTGSKDHQMPNASGTIALRAADSTGSPINMIYQGTDGLLHKAAVPSGGGGGSYWGLEGSAITTGQFLGTTNNEPLVFKLNGNERGIISGTNIAFGSFINAGVSNAGFGDDALLSATSNTNYNTALGSISLQVLDNGNNNTAVGYNSLSGITAGKANTAIGAETTLATISSTDSSIAIGYEAVASTKQLAFSPHVTEIKATGITGASNSGYVLTTNGSGIATFQAASASSPAGNYGNIQINRNGALDTPGGDSLSFTTGLNVIGPSGITGSFNVTDVSNNKTLQINNINDFGMGDMDGNVNGTRLYGDDAAQTINIIANNGVIITGNITAHNIIGATATQTDANFSATAGTAYVLSGNNSATRTITMPTLVEGDVFEFYNENTSANKWVSSETIYLSDNTTFTTLADDTNYILRYVGGKLRVSN